jgi:diadenosine tetraphosphate (Ap4A) HIT family hydrolase
MAEYDPDNVFARILRGEIPCKKVFENEHALAFHDITPQAKVHVLVIPKGSYLSLNEFVASASDAEIASLVRALGEVAKLTGIAESGYALLARSGRDAHQEVPHLHFHVAGGERLGSLRFK